MDASATSAECPSTDLGTKTDSIRPSSWEAHKSEGKLSRHLSGFVATHTNEHIEGEQEEEGEG